MPIFVLREQKLLGIGLAHLRDCKNGETSVTNKNYLI